MITKIKFAIETVGVHVLKLIKYSHHSIIRPVRWADSAALAMYCQFGYRTVHLIELC